MRGYRNLDDYISAHGGIVSRSELLMAGWSADQLRFGVQLGNLRRRCRGWYGSSALPLAVRAAWAHCGPLACVSALEFLDVIERLGTETAPHVCRPSRAHRVRYDSTATIYWSDDDYASGSRWSVSVDSALAPAARCAPERLPEHERERRTPLRWPGPLDSAV